MTTATSLSDPTGLPDSADPTGPCPRCGIVAHFQQIGQAALSFRQNVILADGRRLPQERVSIFMCSACGRGIVVIEDEYVGGVRHGNSGESTWRGFFWWPTPDSGAMPAEVPTEVADAYREGQRCLSAGAPNGAVAMFRSALTWIVKTSGSPIAQAKGDLKDKIRQMVADGGLASTLGDWADHIRLYGNAGVHPDLFGDVSIDEARDVAGLTATLIELIYITPAKIAQRQAARRKP